MKQLLAFQPLRTGKIYSRALSEPENAQFLDIFYTYEHLKFHAQLSLA